MADEGMNGDLANHRRIFQLSIIRLQYRMLPSGFDATLQSATLF